MIRTVVFCVVLTGSMWCCSLMEDRAILNDQLIRLHVVANSDDLADQNIKLQVRDAVNAYLQKALENATDVQQAKEYLQENLPRIQRIANETLERCGVDADAVVTLCREAFDSRVYDTFSLPSGVYEALRITIGEGEGQNWWCVVYPSLCLPAASESFEDVAAAAGFPERLSEALDGDADYQIRFFLLDCLGKLENLIRG